ncbi:MAG TPA: hypothetical protein PLB05_06020 [Candidatus Omnitrophota bacterium]|nr:hypothetical protein [Candidatus Omnitrophota bacterium]
MPGRLDAIVAIVSAFPGQFTYREILNLDIRDLYFWAKHAKKKSLYDQMKMLVTMRAAVDPGTDNIKAMENEIKSKIRELDVGRDTIIRENWAALKKTSLGR